jgi:DNA polymerase I-like protein with 3'-5' exonuclease and polymerase domains
MASFAAVKAHFLSALFLHFLTAIDILQIHDELVLEVPIGRVAEAAAFIKACMEERPFAEFDLPIVADVSAGTRFGEMVETGVAT